MGDNAKDPIDHHRTTRPHAGVSMKNTAAMPGLIVIGISVAAFVGSLAALANGHARAAIILIGIVAVGAVTATVWLYAQRRRVGRVEKDWHERHPEVQPTTPDS